MKKTLTQRLGLLGIVSLLSYTAAVVFSPIAYPGYNRMAQAVSDLSAADAPSLALWNQLSAFYNACEIVCVDNTIRQIFRYGKYCTLIVLSNRCMYRYTGAKDKTFAHGDISVCRYGVDFGGGVSYVSAFNRRLCG